MKTIKHFEHPFSGVSNETVAVFTDGTSANVCVQYSSVQPKGDHADDCAQITKMGGRCNCGLLDDIDVPALMEAAKKSGKFGRAPVERIVEPVLSTSQRGDGWCDRCQSYCYGDCELID